MDLKSLRERKAMLTEGVALETTVRRPPFCLDPVKLNVVSKNSLDVLSSTCKILKPVSIDGHLESATIIAAADLSYRLQEKRKFPQKLASETSDIRQKRGVLPSVFEEASVLENRVRDQILHTSSEQIKSQGVVHSHLEFKEEYERATEVDAKFNKLINDAAELKKLHEENSSWRERLKKIPDSVQPGFQLTRQSLQSLVEQRRAKLEDLKRQVLEDSSF